MLPLQLSSIFYFIILLLLSPAIPARLIAKHGCQKMCGNLPIPYPFGVGSNCALDPSFGISCNDSTDPPKAYLSTINTTEVIEINETYIRVKYPNLVSVCYDSSYEDKKSVNLSGTPYTLSYRNMLTAIGCDDAVLQSNGSSTNGGCSAFCENNNETGGVGYCPFNGTSLGNGCCQVQINEDTDILGAQLIDLSGKLGRRKLFPCSYAFIQEWRSGNETVFSYPLHYLHNSTALLNDNWASTTRPPVVRLDWKVGAENCSRAKQNSATYACGHDKSVCVDVDADYYYPYTPRGYLCSCVQGYEGNPYLPGGCKPIVFLSSIAKPGCPDQCGKLSIPFPFGVGRNCYLAPSFEINCNTSANPPKAYLSILNAEITRFNSSQVWVNYPNLGLACYNWSDSQRRITKTEDRSLIIDLSKTQFTLSDDSWITAIGCDDMVVGIIRHANQSFVSSTCAAVCSDGQISYANIYGECPYGSTADWPGDGCCRAPIPRGTSYLEANLSDFSGRWPRTNFSCSYAFVGNKDQYYYSSYPILNNSTEIQADGLDRYRVDTIFPLDWRIEAANCKEARLNPADFVCKNNTDCIDFDATVGGYLCNCSKGYNGNPYLSPGCQDIDECADNTTNPCDPYSICINTPGSVQCSCRKGYYGDGKKDGKGCILRLPSTSKMTILIGLGSPLGLLLLLLFSFWLHKVFEKRNNKKRKENLFKHLLLQQQTSEGTFGKTKLFTAKELDKATDHFNESRICGQGGQGIVYKGMLSDGTIVAIKKLRQVNENQVEQFINEVVILSQINHKNVVKLLGCCLATEAPQLVYEFLPNGTLFDFIRDPKIEFPLTWNMRLKIAADVAGALAYLHSASSIPIYHRDIKSTNILLDEKYIVKVSDFGISKLVQVDQTHLTTLVKGTFGYLDPEYFQTSQYTDKSDVYSFGVVLLELLTGQQPISLDRPEELRRNLASHFLASMEENNLDGILDAQVSEHGAKEVVLAVARLARRCLNVKGKMRPTMKELAIELESLRLSQIPSTVNDEPEEAADSEAGSMMISDIEYTWTASYKSASTSSLDSHPLIFTTE